MSRGLAEASEAFTPELEVLNEIQRRVHWLAVRMVDEANQRDVDGIKVGGHQASSASVVSLMTALWFGFLRAGDKVAVKPHASPVYHAIQYLIGELDRSYLTKLRARGGLQAYPSRTKDPDVFDFSTGSVGLGAVVPLFSAAVQRYVNCHFASRLSERFIAIAGDAELDEGNVWEAIADPALQGLSNVMLIVDLNRQSLDRVVPQIQVQKWQGFFKHAGWHVELAKYGTRLERVFDEPGGQRLKLRIDEMSNEEYQGLYVATSSIRDRLVSGDSDLAAFLSNYSDSEISSMLRDLGGHDIRKLIDAFNRCDDVVDQPSVIFAYTVKGWGLPFEGDPLNHAAMLSKEQIDDLRRSVGLEQVNEWDRFDEASRSGDLCSRVGRRLTRSGRRSRPTFDVPAESGRITAKGTISTQVAFGRMLVGLAEVDGLGARLVTASPDVSISTNLGGWINSIGVFSHKQAPDFFDADRLLRWSPNKMGQHIELGISEMNLFLLLGQLGLSYELHGEALIPIGTVYDPFVLRGLDALVYSLYNGARFVVVGTPSGVTLAPEGGAHQSSITPSVGLELPGLTPSEPAYALAADWLLCDAIKELFEPNGGSHYMRLSTRPIDQTPFEEAIGRLGRERLRGDVLAGAYRLREPRLDGPKLVLIASGPVMPEVLLAAEDLEDEGVSVTVVDVTSQGRLYKAWRAPIEQSIKSAAVTRDEHHLSWILSEDEREAAIVTVHDGASHSFAWIGSALGRKAVNVGVDDFGESGSITDLYTKFGLMPGSIVNAALVALSRSA